jgi:hypothetical protein
MLRRRADSTFVLTEEITDWTVDTIPVGGLAPTSNSLIAIGGGVTRKQIGARNEEMKRSQPGIGLEANPAQITSPRRFGGLEAAHSMAIGEENDSARSTNGPESTVTDSRSCVNSEKERVRSAGYRTIWTSKPFGSASTNCANKSPVPSMPGRRTSLGARVNIEVMVASAPLDGNPSAKVAGSGCMVTR